MAMLIGVRKVVVLLGLVGANIEVQLTRESGVEESVVGENPGYRGEDFAFAQWR